MTKINSERINAMKVKTKTSVMGWPRVGELYG